MGFGYVFPRVRLRLGATREEHESVEREIKRPWPFKHTFRPNPTVDAGTLYTLTASASAGLFSRAAAEASRHRSRARGTLPSAH